MRGGCETRLRGYRIPCVVTQLHSVKYRLTSVKSVAEHCPRIAGAALLNGSMHPELQLLRLYVPLCVEIPVQPVVGLSFQVCIEAGSIIHFQRQEKVVYVQRISCIRHGQLFIAFNHHQVSRRCCTKLESSGYGFPLPRRSHPQTDQSLLSRREGWEVSAKRMYGSTLMRVCKSGEEHGSEWQAATACRLLPRGKPITEMGANEDFGLNFRVARNSPRVGGDILVTCHLSGDLLSFWGEL